MSSSEGRVNEWLRRSGVEESEVGSVYGESELPELLRDGASEYGEVFDEERYVIREETPEVVKADVRDIAVVESALADVAKAAQRKVVCAFHRSYVRGRMLDVPRYGDSALRVQRFFKLESFMQLSSLDDSTLVDALTKGVVRTRLGAQTGMGKTMKLPGLLASKCGLRVCLLELDTFVAKTAMKYQKKLYNIPGGVSSWSRVKKPYLAAMSYDEFRGIVLSGNRERLFEDFDLFYMDEAHEPLGCVWAARAYFAEFAKSHNSLVVASATVSSTVENNVAASNVGKFRVENSGMTLTQALDSGLLLTTHLRDRMELLVASDEDVALARAYYMDAGVDVRVLDSASTDADVQAVITAFSVTTSVVPRVLVALQDYGTSYNLPVTYVVTTCTRRVFEMDASHALIEKEIPLMQKQVVQHQGRVNRGITTGGGGWLLSGAVAADKELLLSEALEAYLSLVAAGIKPRPGLFDTVTKVLPKGMNKDVARMVLRVGLPPALTVRYLGTDGLFASAFVAGVRLFAQTGETLRKSRDKFPIGYEQWVDEPVGDYYLGDESSAPVSLRVPFASPRGLKVAMHTITAVADGLLELSYWDWFEEDEESDDETIGVRTVVKRVARPRLPEAPVQPVFESTVSSEPGYWAYDADPDAAAKRVKRRGMSWDAQGDGKVAIKSLMRAIEDGTVGISVVQPVLDVPEHSGQVVYSLPLDDTATVPVRSPNGSKIMVVSKAVHDAFMAGHPMDETQAAKVVQHLIDIGAVQRFAKSTVFDNWSPAWLSWFSTFSSRNVVEAWKGKGVQSEAFRLLGYLYDRFRAEVISTCLSSNLYKDRLGSFFRSKPSISRLVAALKKGRLPVAQTDQFVNRVLQIKDSYDSAILTVENSGVFLPSQVTNAQRRLPLRDKDRHMPVIDESVVESQQLPLDDGTVRSWRR